MAVDAYYNVYIYTAQVRPFVRRGVLGAIQYILWRRRLYHKALLAIQVFLGPTTSKIRQVIELLRRFL